MNIGVAAGVLLQRGMPLTEPPLPTAPQGCHDGADSMGMMHTAPSTTSVLPEVSSPSDQQAAQRPAGRPPRGAAAVWSAPCPEPLPLLHPRSGVAELMRAVLADALYCYHLGAGSVTRTRRLAHEARAWFHSEDERGPFAFVNVCRALGLDPAAIRRRLHHGNDQAAPSVVLCACVGDAIPPLRRKRMQETIAQRTMASPSDFTLKK
jgi:hypothetical protein